MDAALLLAAASPAAGEPSEDARAVGALLDAWVAAEERGDLPGYAALLAAGFSSSAGPDGRGPTDRAGWLAGVHPRFGTRDRLATDSPEIALGVGLAVARVRLERGGGQGAKARVAWLALAAGDAGWRIQAAEEGADRPRRRTPTATTVDLPAQPVVFAGRPWLVLARARPEQLPRVDQAIMREAEDGWLAWLVDDASSTPDTARWQGRAVVLHDAAGPVCRGTADATTVLVRDLGTPGEPDPAADLALARTWADAPGGAPAVVAIGVVEPTPGACRGTTWGHLEDDAPERLPVATATPALRRLGLDALRRLPTYRAASLLVSADAAPTRPKKHSRRRAARWDAAAGAHVEARVFGPASDGARYLSVSAQAGSKPCVGAQAVWQVFGDEPLDAHLVLLSDPEGPARPFVPDVALARPGALDPVFASAHRMLAPSGALLRPRIDLTCPSYAAIPKGGSTTGDVSATLCPQAPRRATPDSAERIRHEPTPRSP